MKLYIILLCVMISSTILPVELWTHYYPKKIDVTQRHQKQYCFEKTTKTPFSQLLFSWNAKRPLKGYYSFYLRVKDAKTQQWTGWYHIADWGKSVQKSYLIEPYNGIYFRHVRLEMGKKKADAYAIKMVAHHGALLSDISRVATSCADFDQFEHEDPEKFYGSSVIIEGLPYYSQMLLDHPRNGGMCSPTSVSMVAAYLMHKPFDSLQVAEMVYDSGLDAYGSWPFNTAALYTLLQGNYYVSVVRLPSFSHLHQQLLRGIPVILSIRGPIVGSATQYAAGHLIAVIGWDNQTREVICHDPAFPSLELVLKRYPLKDFLIAWERSHRLSYYIEKV